MNRPLEAFNLVIPKLKLRLLVDSYVVDFDVALCLASEPEVVKGIEFDV
jgi:hypothetical protein